MAARRTVVTGAVAIVVTAIAVGGYFGVRGQNGEEPVGPGPVAHEWVSTAGADDCRRHDQAVSYRAALAVRAVCATADEARDVADAGDTALIRPGTYPAPQQLTNLD